MIKQAIILPAYLETLSIQETLLDLQKTIIESTLYIVVDDSPDLRSGNAAKEIWRPNTKSQLIVISNQQKMGRGAAVLIGMKTALKNPEIIKIIEMDSDGSHNPIDVRRVSELISVDCVVIGSRYLPESAIVGWPMSRRIFSRILNYSIPKIFKLNVSDCTNGLRGYSRTAVEQLVNSPQKTTSFIYLTESLLVITNKKFTLLETPITFKDRMLGSSTVTYKELGNSLRGILSLIKMKSRL